MSLAVAVTGEKFLPQRRVCVHFKTLCKTLNAKQEHTVCFPAGVTLPSLGLHSGPLSVPHERQNLGKIELRHDESGTGQSLLCELQKQAERASHPHTHGCVWASERKEEKINKGLSLQRGENVSFSKCSCCPFSLLLPRN